MIRENRIYAKWILQTRLRFFNCACDNFYLVEDEIAEAVVERTDNGAIALGPV